jgi:hypothetical protein
VISLRGSTQHPLLGIPPNPHREYQTAQIISLWLAYSQHGMIYRSLPRFPSDHHREHQHDRVISPQLASPQHATVIVNPLRSPPLRHRESKSQRIESLRSINSQSATVLTHPLNLSTSSPTRKNHKPGAKKKKSVPTRRIYHATHKASPERLEPKSRYRTNNSPAFFTTYATTGGMVSEHLQSIGFRPPKVGQQHNTRVPTNQKP